MAHPPNRRLEQRILQLHREGHSHRRIAKRLDVNVNVVRGIITQDGQA